jgi:hypothetical protein
MTLLINASIFRIRFHRDFVPSENRPPVEQAWKQLGKEILEKRLVVDPVTEWTTCTSSFVWHPASPVLRDLGSFPHTPMWRIWEISWTTVCGIGRNVTSRAVISPGNGHPSAGSDDEDVEHPASEDLTVGVSSPGSTGPKELMNEENEVPDFSSRDDHQHRFLIPSLPIATEEYQKPHSMEKFRIRKLSRIKCHFSK